MKSCFRGPARKKGRAGFTSISKGYIILAMKKLHKIRNNKVLAGVIGGVGEYFELDPVILRLAWVLITVFTGFVPGIIAYIIAAFIVPEKPEG